MRVSQCHRVPCAASSQDDTLSWGPDSHMSRICPKQMCRKFRENPWENDLNVSKRCHLKGWSDVPSQPTAILLGRFPLLTPSPWGGSDEKQIFKSMEHCPSVLHTYFGGLCVSIHRQVSRKSFDHHQPITSGKLSCRRGSERAKLKIQKYCKM